MLGEIHEVDHATDLPSLFTICKEVTMHAQEYTTTLECPGCSDSFEVECSLLVDPGVMYHADGSGTPPSEDFNPGIPQRCPQCSHEFTDAESDRLADRAREAAPDESFDEWARDPDDEPDRDDLDWWDDR